MTPDARIVSEWFGHTVIRSSSKMAYGIAQAIIDQRVKTQVPYACCFLRTF
jgi:exoribonuclease R